MLLATKLTGRSDRQRAINQLLRIQTAAEKAMAARLRPVLSKQTDSIASSLERTSALTSIANVDSSALHTVIASSTHQAFEATGARALASLGVTKTKSASSVFNRKRDAYIAQNAARKIQLINAATMRYIRGKIEEGVNDGEGIPVIARRFRDEITGIGFLNALQRAFMIARTEIHSASVASMAAAVETSGFDVEKEWAAVFDNRTREDHITANGQIRRSGEMFTIGDDELEYPGDSSADPSQIINCRCQVLYRRIV